MGEVGRSGKGRKMGYREGKEGVHPKETKFPLKLRCVDKSLIFHTYIFGQKCLAPKLTELLCLCLYTLSFN